VQAAKDALVQLEPPPDEIVVSTHAPQRSGWLRRDVVSQVRTWDAELPSRTGNSSVTGILNRVTPRFPRPPLWLAVGLVALVWRRPRDWRTILVLWGAALAVLLIHAASQGLAPEFALPLYPVFIVTAVCAVAGDRGSVRSRE